MQQPMEILSLMTTRTDSGAGAPKRPQPGVESNGSKFEGMFQKELSRHETRAGRKHPNSESIRPLIEPEDDKSKDKAAQELITGVMGNQQNEVVIILEGDRESATTPQMRVETPVEPPDTPKIKVPETTETEQFKFADEVKTAITTQAAQHATADAETNANKSAAANADANTQNNFNAAGEVSARMPEIKTQERQENTDTNPKSSDNGNLSPLENENDETKIKGQKTYSETADAVRSTEEGKTEPAVAEIPPPLSEGIKPEQFRSTQQMTQATLSAPVKAENLFQEMISRVEMMQNDTKSAMTIQLKPEFLGNVALEVAVDAAGLHVKINAEDHGVRGMINSQLAALIESLENKGIGVVEVEVTYTGVNNGAFKEPGEGQQQSNTQKQTKNREVSSADGAAYYAIMPDLLDYYLESGVSSVEYRA